MEIIKSPNDNRDYFTYKIPQNKMDIFLIHDKDADISCASMIVKVGYMQDEISGLAHFLEHMLFSGTVKYPKEGEFMNYIEKNGGQTNAMTAHSYTCYYYTIRTECFEKSLDMFGNFFISPLLDPHSVEREKKAVNSEHLKNVHNDTWRIHELLLTSCYLPYSKFGTGSDKTLNVSNIDKLVKDFYLKYYSSDLMTLCIITKLEIPIIKNIIDNIFSQVKLNTYEKINEFNFSKILNTPCIIKTIPLNDVNTLIIHWELPSYHDIPHKSPINFILYLL